MKRIIGFMLLFVQLTGSSQNILQDNKGTTSISLHAGESKGKDPKSASDPKTDFGLSQIKLSTAEKKLEANYYHYFRKDKVQPSFLGVSLSGEIKNSLTSLVSSGDVAPGSSIKIKWGKRLYKKDIADYDEWETDFKSKNGRDPSDAEVAQFVKKLSDAKDVWFVMNTGLDGSKFKLFYPDSAFGAQIKKINFTKVEFNAGLNFWFANFVKSTMLAGVTMGYKVENNFDDLSESTSEDVTIRTNPADTTTRKVTEKITLYKGKYKETITYPLNVDLYFKPHKFKGVAFLLFARHSIQQSSKPQTKLGAGIYFLKEEDLFDPSFGINIDYADVFNNDPSDDSKPKFSKLKIGVVLDLKTLLFQKKG